MILVTVPVAYLHILRKKINSFSDFLKLMTRHELEHMTNFFNKWKLMHETERYMF